MVEPLDESRRVEFRPVPGGSQGGSAKQNSGRWSPCGDPCGIGWHVACTDGVECDDAREGRVSMRLHNYWRSRWIAEGQTSLCGRRREVAPAFLVGIVTLVCAVFVSSSVGGLQDKLRSQSPIQFGVWYGLSARPVPTRLAKLFAANLEPEEAECQRSGATRFAWTELDLSSDGASDLIVEPLDECTCSPTGNCDLWVFRNTRSGYSNILTAEGRV